jgi:hypothetical protein
MLEFVIVHCTSLHLLCLGDLAENLLTQVDFVIYLIQRITGNLMPEILVHYILEWVQSFLKVHCCNLWLWRIGNSGYASNPEFIG